MAIASSVRGVARHGLGQIAFAAMLWGTVGVATQGLYHTSAANPLSEGLQAVTLSRLRVTGDEGTVTEHEPPPEGSGTGRTRDRARPRQI